MWNYSTNYFCYSGVSFKKKEKVIPFKEYKGNSIDLSTFWVFWSKITFFKPFKSLKEKKSKIILNSELKVGVNLKSKDWLNMSQQMMESPWIQAVSQSDKNH